MLLSAQAVCGGLSVGYNAGVIDGNSTTYAWQTHTGRICVWPVGAFEQHGHHLPLATDNILANEFARRIAVELDAALLPCLPLGTSFEHSGFRGSLSLRPETAMAVVRDVADEVERQGFERLIIVNGHGGNFFLIPVSRDINRADRRLKVLLVAPGASSGRPIGDDGPDLHAGMHETSLMLAVAPERVGPIPPDAGTPPTERPALAQSDLTHFGVGHFSPDGPIGRARSASAEFGQREMDQITSDLVAHLRERLDYLDQQRRYAGPGGLALRPLGHADLPEAVRLSRTAGWNQTESDWRFMLDQWPLGCTAAVHQGRAIATTCALRYDASYAWIGMVLVDPEFRRLGLARRLMTHAIEYLCADTSIMLDATPDGREVYRQLGFEDVETLSRWTANAPQVHLQAHPAVSSIRAMLPSDLDAVAELDRGVVGADRRALLTHLLECSPGSAVVFSEAGAAQGFALGRSGMQFHHVGPIVAANDDVASTLLDAAIHRSVGRSICIDVPDSMQVAAGWLTARGFIRQRTFIRMQRKGKAPVAVPTRAHAIAGPDFG